MKRNKHYSERVPKVVKEEYYKLLGVKLGLFATYAKLLDKLYDVGYWIELQPFHTFSYADRMGVIYKLWKRDENERWHCIFDEEKDWSSDDGFGCSFWYALNTFTLHRIQRDIEKQKRKP